MSQRKPKNSSKVNFTVSAVFHTLLIGGIAFLAAREGMLGTHLKTLAATIVPKDKPKIAPVKDRPVEPKPDAPKVAQEKPRETATAPKVETTTVRPLSDSGPAAAPVATIVGDVDYYEGKDVITDPNMVYKSVVEHSLRSRWNRPDDMDDDKFVVNAELTLDPTGKLLNYHLVDSSGNARWDNSVKNALAATKAIGQRPPKGFPGTFSVKFDVETTEAEPSIQVSSR